MSGAITFVGLPDAWVASGRIFDRFMMGALAFAEGEDVRQQIHKAIEFGYSTLDDDDISRRFAEAIERFVSEEIGTVEPMYVESLTELGNLASAFIAHNRST